MRPPAILHAGVLLVAGGCALGGCEPILKAVSGDRHVDPHVDCASGKCVCTGGFGDCDGDVDNGCEADLSQAPNCGACGATCSHGTCAGATCTCHTGFADCDDDRSNGCEAQLADDPRNCGACGVRCGIGTCAAGVCQAATVGTVTGASSILVAFNSVYVGSCNPDGPAIVEFQPGHAGSTPVGSSTGCVHALAAAGTQIAWAGTGAILASPITGSSASTPIAGGVFPTIYLAGGPSSVYWWDAPSDPTKHALLRASLVGPTTPETIAAADVTALTADDTSAYWSDATGLHSVPHGETAVVDLDASIHATALVVGFGDLYAGSPSGIQVLSLSGGMPTLVAPAMQVEGMAAESGMVYWADAADGTVKRADTSGATVTVTVLATGQSPFAHGVRLFTDATSVYWLSGNDVRAIGK